MIMWIAKKTAQMAGGDEGSSVGKVSVGGVRPAVVTDGEVRETGLLALGGSVYVPRTGDEVLLETTGQGEKLVLGRVLSEGADGVGEGELMLCTPGGSGKIVFKKNGDIEISGNITLTGTTNINGTLMINGVPYIPMLL